jgi:hypothetical protein
MDVFIKKVQDRRIDSKYSLVRKLGEGGFCSVYLGMFFPFSSQKGFVAPDAEAPWTD